MPDRRWLFGGLALAAGVGLARLLVPGRPRIHDGSRVLLIGDSHAQGLNVPLREMATERGIPYVSLAKVGSRIDQWASEESLAKALREFDPTLVLVSLGTNDAYMSGDVTERQAPHLQALLDLLRDRDVVWIGPPQLPDPHSGMTVDHGFLRFLASNAPNFLDTSGLIIPMGPDGIHPTVRGYAGWAGATWAELDR